MKTYFHYLIYLLKKRYKEDPLDVIMPLWFGISLSLIFGGAWMFALSSENGNFGALWWLTLTLAGVLSFPLIALKIAVWIEEKFNHYNEWKNGSPVTTSKP